MFLQAIQRHRLDLDEMMLTRTISIGQGPGLQSFLKVKVTFTLRCDISKAVFDTLY